MKGGISVELLWLFLIVIEGGGKNVGFLVRLGVRSGRRTN